MSKKHSYDTEKALDMLIITPGNWRKKERKIAEKYGLDFKKMITLKLLFIGFALLVGFLISELAYDRLPAIITGFIFAVYILGIIFVAPLSIQYFSKK